MFITGVVDTGDKLFTGEKFIAGVVDTDEQFIFRVSLIPFRKKTKSLKFIAGVNDTAEKIVHRCQRHR
jgi:hypothetical protein